MNTKDMIEVMRAYAEGKTIEAKRAGRVTTTVCTRDWSECPKPVWDWLNVQYRIAPEPKKEGRWERVEIRKKDGWYRTERDIEGVNVVDALRRIPGFGGIDYRSPFDPEVIVRSMVPVMFRKNGEHIVISHLADARPGIPVAAWFWKEGEK